MLISVFPNFGEMLTNEKWRKLFDNQKRYWTFFKTNFLSTLIVYTYTGELELTTQNVQDLHVLGRALHDDFLVRSCNEFIVKR